MNTGLTFDCFFLEKDFLRFDIELMDFPEFEICKCGVL